MSQQQDRLNAALQRRVSEPAPDTSLDNVMYGNGAGDVFAELAAIKGAGETPQVVVQTEYVEVVPDGAIVPSGDKAMQFGSFTLEPLGIVANENTTQEEWDNLGFTLFKVARASQWWIGDWLNKVNKAYKYTVENISATVEIDPETLYDWQKVSESLPLSLRNGKLSFSHHRAVAYLKTKDREPDHKAMEKWLNAAAENGWSVKQLRAEIVKAKRGAVRTTPKLANKNNKSLIGRVWRAVQNGKPVDRADIQALKKWLADVERYAVGNELEYSDDTD